MPFFDSNFPVKPLMSHDGDHLQRIAFLTQLSNAIWRVRLAPQLKNRVTFSPVTNFLYFLSGHVKNASPLLRFIGGRGHGRPPNISGQMEISSISGCFFIKRFMKLLMYNFFPCQRHDTPNKHDETKIFLSFIGIIIYQIIDVFKKNMAQHA